MSTLFTDVNIVVRDDDIGPKLISGTLGTISAIMMGAPNPQTVLQKDLAYAIRKALDQ